MTITNIGTIDINDIASLLTQLPDASSWPPTSRETKFNVHVYTKSLIIRSHCNAEGEFEPGVFDCGFKDYPIRSSITEINKITDYVCSLGYGSNIGRILITAQREHKEIPLHVDFGAYLENYNRIHIPLVSHPDVIFESERIGYYMEPGNIYLLENNKVHAVYNNSDIVKMHMIIDVI